MIVQKFKDNFFVRDLMKKSQFEEEKDEKSFQQSFYRKEGLDYLYFQRPGTAYGSESFAKEAGMGDSTR